MTSRLPRAPPPLSPAPTADRRIRPWRRWLFDYGPALLMMGVIFVASTDVGSSAHSGRILRPILSWLGLVRRLTPAQFELVNHYARKACHMAEYALLGGLLHRAVVSTRPPMARWRARWVPGLVLFVLAAIALYAASDEFHQVFVATRTPSVWDVMLDTLGGAVGLGVKWGWERWRPPLSG